MKEKNKTQIYGTNATEAWADAESFDPDTHVNNPHEEAVETAKQWIDQNEL